MKGGTTILHHAEDRGKGEYGWLSTRYSFSFANWYNPARMGFGALRVINDDTIAPGSGFGEHSHADMEIITIVLSGTLTHKDSMRNLGTIQAGEVQVMSAGTGVAHAEYNASDTDPLTLFQLWILPNKARVEPRYAQKQFAEQPDNSLLELVGPLSHATDGPLGIHQNAYITRAKLGTDGKLIYSLKDPQHGVYAFVISGSPLINGMQLRERDALGSTGTGTLLLTAEAPADVLLIEVPMAEK